MAAPRMGEPYALLLEGPRIVRFCSAGVADGCGPSWRRRSTNHRHRGVAVGAGRCMHSDEVSYRRHSIDWSWASCSLMLVGPARVLINDP